MSEGFLGILKKRGYDVKTKKLGGGFVNDVQLVTAMKDGQTIQYVLKKYSSADDLKSTLRGYDLISKAVNTPTIVYTDNTRKEVAYDLVQGKSLKNMIEDRDEDAPEAMKILSNDLQKLHNSKRFNPHYERDDSPDEKKIRKHSARVYSQNRMKRNVLQGIQKAIREYKPDNKSIIHGDAHLGNFLYSHHKVYTIDPDNVKLSDYNADLGKVVGAIEELEDDGKISQKQSNSLKDLFLFHYEGENETGVHLHRLRTPLIQSKGDKSDKPIRKIFRILNESLEARIAAAAITCMFLITLLLKATPTGNVILNSTDKGSLFLILSAVIIIIAIIVYVILKKRK